MSEEKLREFEEALDFLEEFNEDFSTSFEVEEVF